MASSGLPDGWEWRTFGGDTGVSTINPPRPSFLRDSEASTSFLPMQGVDEVDGIIAQLEIRPYREVRTGYTYFEENDVLFAKITPSMQNGKSAIAKGLIDGIGFGSTEFHVLRPRPGILPEWLHLFVRQVSFRQEAMRHFRGAVGQQRVPKEFLIGHPIPLPYPSDVTRSLESQRRIVARVKTLFVEVKEMQGLSRQITAATGSLMDATLAQVFAPEAMQDWTSTSSLGEVAEISAPLVDPTLPEYRDLPHIYGRVVEEGTGRLLDYNTAAEDGMRSGKYLFKAGAVLYSKIRPYLRKVTLVDFDGLCSADMYPLQVKSEAVLPEFLMWALLSPDFTDYANSLSGRARIPKLNREQLFAYQLRYPTRKIQERIDFYLRQVRSEVVDMLELSENDTKLLGQMEQAILAQAFRGEL